MSLFSQNLIDETSSFFNLVEDGVRLLNKLSLTPDVKEEIDESLAYLISEKLEDVNDVLSTEYKLGYEGGQEESTVVYYYPSPATSEEVKTETEIVSE